MDWIAASRSEVAFLRLISKVPGGGSVRLTGSVRGRKHKIGGPRWNFCAERRSSYTVLFDIMAKDAIQGLQHAIGRHVAADDQVCGTAVDTGCLADGKNRGRRLNPPSFALNLLKRHWHGAVHAMMWSYSFVNKRMLSMTASTRERPAQPLDAAADTVNGRPLAFR